MNQQPKLRLSGDSEAGTPHSYSLGFGLSVILTLVAYLVVKDHVDSHHQAFSHKFLVPYLLGLAVIQLLVQLIFFLHLARESKPRWNLVVLVFAVMVVGIVVGGSIWIMDNLNYNTMSPSQTDNHILHDEGVK